MAFTRLRLATALRAAAAAAWLVACARGTAQGALKLDNYTFDKVISIPDHTFLVKFDQSYAYGEKENDFKDLCKLAHTVPKFLIAEVPVQEYGDKENDDLRQRYKLAKDDFPAYFLFNKAFPEGLRYTGKVKAEDLATWLRRKQVKVPAIGTIEELDGLAKKFMRDGFADAPLRALQAAAEAYSTDPKAAIYVKIAHKVKEKGEEYVAAETARVAKILETKNTPEKRTELGNKMKVLGAFASKDEL